MIKSVLRLAPLLALVCLLAACGPKTAPQGENTISYTDALGRPLTLSCQPQRVAALIGSFAEVWQLAGGSVCATAQDAWDDFSLELPDAVSIGGAHSPSLELLLSAQPELVLASASTASNVQLLEVLESAGIPVVYFDVDHFEDYLAMLDFCTDLTGRKDLYRQNGLAVRDRVEAIKADFAARGLSEQDRTVLLLRAASGSVKAKDSQGTILGEMLRDLGCINIADSDTSLLETLSVESVIRREPRHIFVVTMGSDTQKAMDNLDRLMTENPAWGTLEAVTEGRLHVMDRRLFNIKPNARWAESYEILTQTLLGDQ